MLTFTTSAAMIEDDRASTRKRIALLAQRSHSIR